MTRIIIEGSAGILEVEQTAFDAGFFPDYVYVRDAGGSPSTEPAVFAQRITDLIDDPDSGPSVALRAAFAATQAGTPTDTATAAFVSTSGTETRAALDTQYGRRRIGDATGYQARPTGTDPVHYAGPQVPSDMQTGDDWLDLSGAGTGA